MIKSFWYIEKTFNYIYCLAILIIKFCSLWKGKNSHQIYNSKSIKYSS